MCRETFKKGEMKKFIQPFLSLSQNEIKKYVFFSCSIHMSQLSLRYEEKILKFFLNFFKVKIHVLFAYSITDFPLKGYLFG